MVVCRLSRFLEYHKILSISQSGIWQRQKTTDHMLRLHDAIQKSLGEQTQRFVCIDWSRKGLRYGEQMFFFPSCLDMEFQVACLDLSIPFFQIAPFK